MLFPSDMPLWTIVAVFAVAALVVWRAGSRLPVHVEGIARRTGLGQAFAGMLLLGSITTLPELSTTISAAAAGAGELAINNSLGSVAFNILLLAIADAVLGPAALTSAIAKPTTLFQGVLGMLLLATASAAVVAGDTPLLGAGVWSTLLFALCLGALWVISRYETRPTWAVVDPPPVPEPDQAIEQDMPLGALVRHTAGLAGLILAGGVALSQSGDAISARLGIDAGLVGFVLVALATSLPELSVVTTAMRRRQYELAVGDIFGANLFNIAMIFIIDLAYPGEPVLGLAGAFEAVAALLALVMTGLFVMGLLERRDRTLLRMGYDSIAAIIVYGAGVLFLANLAAAS